MSQLPYSEEGDLREKKNSNFNRFIIKELFDKVGFGFGSQQFINILFWQTGASLFLVGIINTLRVLFGNGSYLLIGKLGRKVLNKKMISLSGIIFGFSFLLIAVSIFVRSVILFSLAIIIGSITIVFYGEAKSLFSFRNEKVFIIEKLTKYGLVITAVSLFFAAYIMDKFPSTGSLLIFEMFNQMFKFEVMGYLFVFEIAAISFIIAGYFILNIKNEKTISFQNNDNKVDYKELLSNKIIILLVAVNIIIGIVQTVGFSYYGIYIYSTFKEHLFGGFLNVAMVFLISVFTSLIGYFITKINTKVYKKFYMLIFGAIMVAVMPYAYFFWDDLIVITMATIIGVIGGSVVGVSNSILAIELISHNLRQAYFSFTNIISIPFFIVVVPILAFIANNFGLKYLFLILALILLIVVIILLLCGIIYREEVV